MPSCTFSRILSTSSIILASALLVSCGEKENKTNASSTSKNPAEAAATPAATADATPAAAAPATAPAATSSSAKDQLFEKLLFSNQALMCDYAANPIFTEPVRETLALMQEYYNSGEAKAGSLERFKLAQAIAKTCLKLKAYARAEENYQTALSDYESLSNEDKTLAKKELSNLYNGYASCLLVQEGKQDSAKEYYEKQLQLDKELFSIASTKVSGDAPASESVKAMQAAAANLASSYRCKGDCLVVTDELEEARDIYKKGIALAQGIKPVSSNIAFEYIELLTSLGNLESRCGKLKESVTAWASALKICEQINKQSKVDADKLRSKTYYERLKPLVENGVKQLKSEQEEAKELMDPIPSIDEVSTPSPVEAAPAPAPEAAPASIPQ